MRRPIMKLAFAKITSDGCKELFFGLGFNMYSASLRKGLGTPFDYFHRTTWPLVLGKLFLAPTKNVENTWPERI